VAGISGLRNSSTKEMEIKSLSDSVAKPSVATARLGQPAESNDSAHCF
jgi:hypothetical protein